MKSATSAVVESLCCALACLLLTSCGGGRFSKEIGSLLTEEITGRNLPVTITGQRVTCVSRDLHGTLVDFEATLLLAENLYTPVSLEVEDIAETVAQSKDFLKKMEPVLTEHERQSLPALPNAPIVYEIETPKGKTAKVSGALLILDGGPTSEHAIKLLNFTGDFADLAGQRLQEGWVVKEDSEEALRAYSKELDAYIKAVRELWDTKAKPAVETLKKFPAINGVATTTSAAAPLRSDSWDVSAEFLLDDRTQQISGSITWNEYGEVQPWTGRIEFNPATKQPQIIMEEASLRPSVRRLNPTYPQQGCQYLLDFTATGWSGEWRHPPAGGAIQLSVNRLSPSPVVTPTPTPTPTPVNQTIIVQPSAISAAQDEQTHQRFVAVKVSEEGSSVNVRIYDTKKKDWLDESTFRLDPEPALGEALELDGVKAVYVGEQNFGADASSTPQPSPPATSGEQPTQDTPARDGDGSQDASTNAQEAASAPAPSITYQPSTAPQAPSRQTWEEQVANTVAQMTASPRMQEVLKKGTRYVAIDVPPSASTPSGEKPVMVLDLQTGRLVDNQVYNVKATPPPTPKIVTRYIAVPVPPSAQTPIGTVPIMLYDAKTKRLLNNTVYNVRRTPQPGSVVRFGNIEATYVAP